MESSAERYNGQWLHGLAVLGLAANLVLIGVSLWSALFGPRGGLLFGVVGFMVGWVSLAVGGSSRKMKSVLRSLPEGLLGPRAFPSLRRWLERLVGVVMASAGLGVLVLFASARLGGVADFPAFEKLPKYELHNHGQRTEVSRFRYVTVSASFALGWHSGAALMSLVCLYRLLYGKVPKQFSKEE